MAKTPPLPNIPSGQQFSGALDDEKTLDARLNHIEAVQTRSRATLGILVTLSFTIIFAAYNAYFSWNRHFATHLNWYGSDEAGGNVVSPVANQAHEFALRAWIDSRFVNIPVLGMKIPVDDIEVLGGLTIALLAFVYRHFVRQEHRAISLLLSDTKECSAPTRRRVYYGIGVYKLLGDVIHKAFSKTSYPPGSILHRDQGETLKRSVSKAFVALTYLPAVVLGLLFCVDMLALFLMDTPFRLPHNTTLWSKLGADSRWWAGVYLGCSVSAAVVSWHFLRDVVTYEALTSENLDLYGDELLKCKMIPQKLE